ncbi:5-bromo-4-chloroindolyl phosphate hydrolysis family protein [Bacillus sp. B15-48]|uniref:5-bromo-4-chloroindolyl phosphate hydrolysis family protein n=1 Tax=Bacillus sp. B15-48 TaxID=1548601 RepID=UPI00193EDD54|nr:protein xpaC [Bacillus sp. B15-48]
MHPFLSFLIRTVITVPTAVTVWLLSYFAFNQTFLMASGISLAGGALVYGLVSFYSNHRFLKKNAITRKEYRYIKQNLDEAKPKVARLQKTLFSIRHLPSLKERMELVRVIRKIYTLTKKEPKRFYLAERFYFSHLDSVLELSEKYAFLSAQPKRNRELENSLYDTRETLKEMGKLVENDLYKVLEGDIDDLNFEIDVAKNSINTVRGTRITRTHKGIKPSTNKATDQRMSAKERKDEKNPQTTEWKSIPATDKIKSEEKQMDSPGPKYFINTNINEKETVKMTRETKDKDEYRRFDE